jgi:DNA-binding NtrC family response regulator
MAALERGVSASETSPPQALEALAEDELKPAAGKLDNPALEASGATPALPAGTLMTIEEMERHLIGQALNETEGNRTHAARILGISVRTLRNKLAEYRVSA